MGETNLASIYIYEILQKYSDKEHKLNRQQIQSYLRTNYDIEISERKIAYIVQALKEEGRVLGERNAYCSRVFSDHELRILIDGIFFGRHVTAQQAQTLIEKLKELGSNSLRKHIRHIYYTKDMARTENDNLYEILDGLDEAIERRSQVRITQCVYDMDKKLVRTHDAEVSPYYIVSSRGMYYLICYAGRNEQLETRRIDRILEVEVLDKGATDIRSLPEYSQKSFDLPEYMREHLYMFSGSCSNIEIRIQKRHIGDIIDWCGKGFRIVREDEDDAVIRVYVNENAFYYWCLQYGTYVEVLKPEYMRKRMREGLLCMLEKYK